MSGTVSEEDMRAVCDAAAATEKALRDELAQVRRIVGDIRMLARTGMFKQWEDEPWLKRVMNIDLRFDPVKQCPGGSAND